MALLTISTLHANPAPGTCARVVHALVKAHSSVLARVRFAVVHH